MATKADRMLREATVELDRLRGALDAHTTLLNDPRLDAAYRAQQLKERRAELLPQFRATAVDAHAQLTKLSADLSAEHARLQTQADDRIDWQRLAGLRQKYEAELKVPSLLSPSARLLEAFEQAMLAGDVHRQRALADVAQGVIAAAAVDRGSPDRAFASELRAKIQAAALAELGSAAATLDAEREAARRAAQQLEMTLDRHQQDLDAQGYSRSLAGELHQRWASGLDGARSEAADMAQR